jgi:Na+/H+ antiporter
MSIVALILLLIAATAGLRLLADRLHVPVPTMLVLGGLGVAFIPGLPRLALDPDSIFLIFIPPLLFWASMTTSLRDLKRNMRAIALLAIGLVIATMTVVAVVAHALVPHLPWALCFVLGAIVSPPDAVAVTASTRTLGLPSTMHVILEGESLVNDATALVAYQIALTAAVSGTFSLTHASADFLLTGAGGIAVGLGTGWCVAWVRARIANSAVVKNTISLLSPFIAFIPANALGCSGVLAVVAMGLYLGRTAPHRESPATRLQATAMWEILTFLLEGLIFILIGLELPQVVGALDANSLAQVIGVSCAVVAAMIVTRLLWVFPGAYLPRWIDGKVGRGKPNYPPWRQVLFAGWAGIRGGDSLVIALALPYTGLYGAPLAGRNSIIFITFMAILITLVVQGMTLTPLIRLLGIEGGKQEHDEEMAARHASQRAATQTLERFAAKETALTLEQAITVHAADNLAGPGFPRAVPVHLRLEMIASQRQAVISLRDRNEISDTVLRQLEREFDHEEMLLNQRFK